MRYEATSVLHRYRKAGLLTAAQAEDALGAALGLEVALYHDPEARPGSPPPSGSPSGDGCSRCHRA
ncbi:MAG: type II toxin-antitoxin system VapC family toxin [Deltaproteobacteria bacterium]|nr:type II toxin-antitoxin system VapC family toxin [Deltaproteobacteria bacterium]